MHYLVGGDFQFARFVPGRAAAGPARRSRGSGWGTSRPLATAAAAILASTGGDEGRCHRAAAGGLLRTARLGDAVTRCVAARDLERLLSFRAHTAICPQLKGFSGGPAWTRKGDLFLIREGALLSPRTAESANSVKVGRFLHLGPGCRSAEYRRVPPRLVSALVSNSGSFRAGLGLCAAGSVPEPGERFRSPQECRERGRDRDDRSGNGRVPMGTVVRKRGETDVEDGVKDDRRE
jgi:hypothetical protein